MVDEMGSQCGYCTPGFVMALIALVEQQQPLTRDVVELGLTGNLCRCTGYQQIYNAALSLDTSEIPRLSDRYRNWKIDKELEKIKTIRTQLPEIHFIPGGNLLSGKTRRVISAWEQTNRSARRNMQLKKSYGTRPERKSHNTPTKRIGPVELPRTVVCGRKSTGGTPIRGYK